MRGALFRTLISGLTLMMAPPLAAADISVEAGDGLDFIFISGEIEASDVAHFQRLAVSSNEAVIVLESPGGSLAPALEIGEIIRLKGFYTYVPNGTTCTSSCALIWVAGQTRYLASDAFVGFHASYILSGGQQIETGVGNAMVGRYLTLLNLPEKTVVFATSAPPNEIRWINTSNPAESGITFEIFDLEDAPETPSGDSQSSTASMARLVEEFEWQEGVWTVSSVSSKTGCYMIAEFANEEGVKNYSWMSVGRSVDGMAYLAFHNQRFQAIRDNENYDIGITFQTGENYDDGWGIRTFSGSVHEGGMRTLSVNLDWNSLREDIANEDHLYFSMDGETIDYFPLEGSWRAVRQLERCLGTAASQSSDPFAR